MVYVLGAGEISAAVLRGYISHEAQKWHLSDYPFLATFHAGSNTHPQVPAWRFSVCVDIQCLYAVGCANPIAKKSVLQV